MKSLRVAGRFGRNVINIARGVPTIIAANLLVTRKCTQNCLQCSIPNGDGTKTLMSYDDFRLLIDRLNSHGTHFLNITGGEPLLHPRLNDMIHYAAGKQLLHLQLMSTLYAPRPVVEETVAALMAAGAGLQTSFDGFDGVADRLRGAADVADTVIRGMELVNRENGKRKKPIRTSVNVVINRLNLHQVPDILDYVESVGWKANVDVYRWSSGNHREMEELKLDDSEQLGAVLERLKERRSVVTPTALIDGYRGFLRGRFTKRCPYLERPSLVPRLFVEPDGDVKVCIGDAVGNLIEQTPAEIFRSRKWEAIKREMERCPGCWNACYTPSAMVFHPTGLADLRTVWETVRKG